MNASFFSMIATLGTPLDLTTQELLIEMLFPADEETKQTAVETAILKIQEIGRIIANVNEFVAGIAGAMEEQTTTTRDIAANVVQVSNGIHDVNRTVAQSSTASAQIAGELSEVNASVDGMTRSNAKVHQNAEELSRLADQLKGLVGRFTV